MRLKALTLRYVLNIYIMGVGSLENFLRPRKGPGLSFSSARSTHSTKIYKFLGVKKVNFGGQNDLKKNLFLNVSKVFGT